jgi:hypothetical protein
LPITKLDFAIIHALLGKGTFIDPICLPSQPCLPAANELTKTWNQIQMVGDVGAKARPNVASAVVNTTETI